MALSTCSVLFLTTSAYTRNLKVSCNLYGTKHGLPIGLLSRKKCYFQNNVLSFKSILSYLYQEGFCNLTLIELHSTPINPATC